MQNNKKQLIKINFPQKHLTIKPQIISNYSNFCLFYDWDGTIFSKSLNLLEQAQDQTAFQLTSGKITHQDFPEHLANKNSMEVATHLAYSLKPYANVSGIEYINLRDKIYLDLVDKYQLNNYDQQIVNKIIQISNFKNIHIPQIIVTAGTRERTFFGIKKLFGKTKPFDLIVTYDDIYDYFKIHPTSKHRSFKLALNLLNIQSDKKYNPKNVYMFEDSLRAIKDAKDAKIDKIIAIHSIKRNKYSDYTTYSLVDAINWALKREISEDSDLKLS